MSTEIEKDSNRFPIRQTTNSKGETVWICEICETEGDEKQLKTNEPGNSSFGQIPSPISDFRSSPLSCAKK